MCALISRRFVGESPPGDFAPAGSIQAAMLMVRFGSRTDYCGAQIERLLTGRGFPEGMTERRLDLSVESFPPLIPVNLFLLDSSLRPYCVKSPVSELSTIRGTTHPMN